MFPNFQTKENYLNYNMAKINQDCNVVLFSVRKILTTQHYTIGSLKHKYKMADLKKHYFSKLINIFSSEEHKLIISLAQIHVGIPVAAKICSQVE